MLATRATNDVYVVLVRGICYYELIVASPDGLRGSLISGNVLSPNPTADRSRSRGNLDGVGGERDDR